jgi:hypothetical protein
MEEVVTPDIDMETLMGTVNLVNSTLRIRIMITGPTARKMIMPMVPVRCLSLP